ncbi:MAG: cysteine desulfurase [Candidatus Rokubacteria bacterium]|nr:cysteine desulfurase [Candidatus Rokubacteria bacterium]
MPLERVRADFPILGRTVQGKPLIYLDSAATAQKPRQVLDALRAFYERSNANVHRSIHTLGEEATELLEAARDRVQRFIGAAEREEIVFTRGTTDAINLVAQTWGRRALGPGDEILLTEMEHHSNLVPWQLLAQETGATLRHIPVTDEGYLDLEVLDRLLTPRTRLVAVTHVSNVLGTINPVARLIARARRVGARVLVDGAQAVPHLPVDVRALGADFYVFSGHKMLGPTGIGVLYGRREVLEPLTPAWGGGEMIREVWLDRATWNDLPWRLEPGTPPIAGAVGLAAAIDYLEGVGLDAIRAHEVALTRLALERLGQVEELTCYGPRDAEAKGGVVAFNLAGVHPHDLAAALDLDGIAVRAGHHCAQPLMRRLGVVGTARASFYLYNTAAEVEALVVALLRAQDLLGLRPSGLSGPAGPRASRT